MPDTNIKTIIAEIRKTAQHMLTLADMLEDTACHDIRQQLEENGIGKQIASDIDPAVMTAILAQALMLADKNNGIAQTNHKPTAKPEKPKKPKTPTQPAETLTTTDNDTAKPAQTTNMNNGYVEKAREVFQRENIPVANPFETWSPEKCEAYYKNLNLHPDSIKQDGSFDRRTAWRIAQVKTVLANKNKTAKQIAPMVKHTPEEVEQLIESLSQTKKTNAKPDTVSSTNLADYLPKGQPINPAVNLANTKTMGERTKAIRTCLNLEIEQMAEKIGIPVDKYRFCESFGPDDETAHKIITALGCSPKIYDDVHGKYIPPIDKTEDIAIGRNIQTIRTQQNASIKDIAKQTGITVEWLRQIEDGTAHANLETLHMIAMSLNCKVRDLNPSETD